MLTLFKRKDKAYIQYLIKNLLVRNLNEITLHPMLPSFTDGVDVTHGIFGFALGHQKLIFPLTQQFLIIPIRGWFLLLITFYHQLLRQLRRVRLLIRPLQSVAGARAHGIGLVLGLQIGVGPGLGKRLYRLKLGGDDEIPKADLLIHRDRNDPIALLIKLLNVVNG